MASRKRQRPVLYLDHPASIAILDVCFARRVSSLLLCELIHLVMHLENANARYAHILSFVFSARCYEWPAQPCWLRRTHCWAG